VTTPVSQTGGTSDPRPDVRIATALRRAILAGAIPPGTRLGQADIASRFSAPTNAAVKALSALRGEQLVIWHQYRWYATPTGPPDPAVSARLGVTLTRLRTAVYKTQDELADAIPARPGIYIHSGDLSTAEAGTWQPRDFWQACDTALGADGTLLRLHDSYYAAPGRSDGSTSEGPDSGSPRCIDDYLPPPAAPGLNSHVARVAGEIATRVLDGHWPPGSALPTQSNLASEHSTNASFVGQALMELAGQGILIRVPGIGYLTPGIFHAPVRAVIAVVLEWDDGSRTRLVCTPGHQLPVPAGHPVTT
jgi:DNA-binding GntR family transcriptional regulator